MSFAVYDLGIAEAIIQLLRPFDASRFSTQISFYLSTLNTKLSSITGRTVTTPSFDEVYNSIIAWRSQNNVPLTDVPDWLVTGGASQLLLESIQDISKQLNAVVNLAVNDPYIPGLRLGRISFARKTGDQVDSSGTYEVEIDVGGGRKETRSISAPGIATIRFSDMLYDVFGEKRKGVQWSGGILEWLKLPTIKANQLVRITNAQALKDLFTPIHTQIADTVKEIRIGINSPTSQSIDLIVADPKDFTKILSSTRIDIPQGESQIVIRGKRRRTLFGYTRTSVKPVQISLINIKSQVYAEIQPVR